MLEYDKKGKEDTLRMSKKIISGMHNMSSTSYFISFDKIYYKY